MSIPQRRVTANSKDDQRFFACDSDTATAVLLAGSFNGWSATATPMTRDNLGHWTVALPLAPGRYEYKFVVDGEWVCDPGSTSNVVIAFSAS